MCGNRQRRDDANLGVRQERGGNDDAVGEVVQSIAHEDHQAAAASLLPIMAVMMAVAITLVMV